MKQITCILIDDETNALEMMEWLIKTYCPHVTIAAMCQSAAEGMAAIENHRPDLVFLDIEMPKMNGFDMLEQMGAIPFEVVFCTAYDQFAIRAFKYSALNYLLKPVDPADLVATVERLQKRQSMPSREQIQLLLDQFGSGAKPTVQRIALTTGDGMVFVTTSDILYCAAESNYTSVVMKGGKKILVSKVLKEIDGTLAGDSFYRIHNSYLINLNEIQKYVRGDGGYVIMNDGEHIGISRTKRQAFMELFDRF